MRGFETGGHTAPKQTGDEAGQSEFFVGARKNADGTIDTSRALKMNPQDSVDFAQAIRKEELRIPEYIRPGSWAMVWYRLRNARFVAKEQLAGISLEVSDKTKVETRDRELGIQMEILIDPMVDPFAATSFKKLFARDTSDEDRKYFMGVQQKSAAEMADGVQQFIDRLETNHEPDEKIIYLGFTDDRFSVSKKEAVRLARDLYNKLLSEQ